MNFVKLKFNYLIYSNNRTLFLKEVNEEWLADKARFSYDGLKRQRLITPMMKVGGKLQNVEWEDALVSGNKNIIKFIIFLLIIIFIII